MRAPCLPHFFSKTGMAQFLRLLLTGTSEHAVRDKVRELNSLGGSVSRTLCPPATTQVSYSRTLQPYLWGSFSPWELMCSPVACAK